MKPMIEQALKAGSAPVYLKNLWVRIQDNQERLSQHVEPALQEEKIPELKINALGQPVVLVDGKPVKWAYAMSRDLFYYLLQHTDGASREEIGGIFWPDHSPEKLEMAFRSTMYRLRRDIYKDVIVFSENVYRFNKISKYTYDVELFIDLVNRSKRTVDLEEVTGLLEEALALYRGDYLTGVYEDWVSLDRDRLRGLYFSALEHLARSYAEQRKLARAIEIYQRLVKEEPFLEANHRELMRLYFRQGNRSAAIHQYLALVKLLDEELGLVPNAETQSLYLRIIA